MVAGLGGFSSKLMSPVYLGDPTSGSVSGGGGSRGARIQPHTGAGSAGAHRRWKARRASGRS
jgi:hypothetical protein